MSESLVFTIDGTDVSAEPGQTIIQAADAAGIYIPRLCHRPDLHPHGSCRVCTVLVNGRPQAACTTPAGSGMAVENDSPRLLALRRDLIDMLFVEGNHLCMFCEASGRCELQALAYRFGILAPKYPFQYPPRPVDASHPDVFIDHNRCILCARCIRASEQLDGKSAFGFVGRGKDKRLAPNSADGLAGTDVERTDRAIDACPVGALVRKRVGYDVPVGDRAYDRVRIGSEIEGGAVAVGRSAPGGRPDGSSDALQALVRPEEA